MTAQAAEPDRFGPQQHNSFFASGGNYVATSFFLTQQPTSVDPFASEVEMPLGSALFEHFHRVARSGGVVYVTRAGVRTFAVVAADVAESLREDTRDRQADLQELIDDSVARFGPVPAEVAEEVDRKWRVVADL